jgi:hypothetical protein
MAEQRNLTELEKATKELIKESLQEIITLEEDMWWQRAKRTWIEKGDKNTDNFHAVASHKKGIIGLQLSKTRDSHNLNINAKQTFYSNIFVILWERPNRQPSTLTSQRNITLEPFQRKTIQPYKH